MMYRIGIAKFIASPAVLFDLLGCAEPTEAGSEPCRVRIGPDQFLDIHVFPTQFKYDLWAEINGQVICQTGQVIPEQRGKNGVRFFDAEGFLRERLGRGNTRRPEWYRRNEWEDLESDTFFVGDWGMAQSFGIRGSFPAFYCFNLLFAPGALTLCVQNVHYLHWIFPSVTINGVVPADEYRPLMEAALSRPHQLAIGDITSRLTNLKVMLPIPMNRVYFGTGHGTYQIGLFSPYTLSISLLDGSKTSCEFKSLEYLDKLLQVTSKEELDLLLQKMSILGLAEVRDE